MSAKEEYKQKMEAEVALVQSQLVELKAKASNLTADARVKHAKQVDKLEEGLVATKAKLKELGDASDDAWESFKDGVDSAWNSLSTATGNFVAKLKS